MNMTLEEEINHYFAGGRFNSAYRLEALDEQNPAWVIRYLDSFGVAIPYEGMEINEAFANVELRSDRIKNIPDTGIWQQCLLLMSSEEQTRREFAKFCCDFVNPGSDGENRKNIVSNPLEWWKNWKLLIGNTIRENKPYSVLGELIIYEYLLEQGFSAHWYDLKSSSHDITCPGLEIEVKSSLSRYENTVHLTGQYQLQKNTSRLFLYFCRFEENENGTCIDRLVDNLGSIYGQSRERINWKLSKLGYRIGNSGRREKYQIHEIREYEVDDKFPRIIPEMFKNGRLPDGIVRLSYDVNLTSVSSRSVDFDKIRL